jgi:hypothetical protein
MSLHPIYRFAQAYLEMAKWYRPQAPGDGFGHVLLSKKQCKEQDRLEREALDYGKRFRAEEDTRSFHIGCSDYRTNKAFMWTIEAARQLASGTDGDKTAIRLLKMAIKEARRAQLEREDTQ